MTRCPQCGRPAWQSHGGMGGHMPPDDPGVCWPRGSRECRLVADARMHGIREGVQIARAKARARDDYSIRWDLVDDEIEAMEANR